MSRSGSTTAEHLRNETVRRLLQRSGPALVRTLRALESGEPVPPAPSAPRIDFAVRRRQIMEEALGSMSREAARVLYLGAKSALEADADYCVRVDRSMGGDAEPWAAVAARATRLDRRMTSLGAPPARRWPDRGPARDTASAHALASECVELADLIRPGWEWTSLERGIVLMARERFDEALELFTPLAEGGFDDEVRYAAARNVCACLNSLDRLDELEVYVNRLSASAVDDLTVQYFLVELAAVGGGASGLRSALGTLRSTQVSTGLQTWSETLLCRSDVLASRSGLTPRAVVALLNEPAP